MLARSVAVLAAALSVGAVAVAAPPDPSTLRAGQRPPPDMQVRPVDRGPPPPAQTRRPPIKVAPNLAVSFLTGPVSLTPASPDAPGAALITLGKPVEENGGVVFSTYADRDGTPGVRFLGLAGRAYAIHCVFDLWGNQLQPSPPDPPDGPLRARFWLAAPDAAAVSAKTFVAGGPPRLEFYRSGQFVTGARIIVTDHVFVATPRLSSAGEVSFTFRPDAAANELPSFFFQGCDVQPSG